MNYPTLFLSTDSIQNSFSSSSKRVQSLPPLHSQYECEECDYKTAKKELMRQHKLVKHTRTANKCSACSYTHYYKAQVRQHFNRVHLNIKRKCTKSGRQFEKTPKISLVRLASLIKNCEPLLLQFWTFRGV